MNKHIELVNKWLNDSDSVTTEELKANSFSADTVAVCNYHTEVDDAVADAAYAADADPANAESAAKYVKRYEELTGE
jgi:hypothetical protein